MSLASGEELSLDVEENSIRRFFRDSSGETASEISLLCFLWLALLYLSPALSGAGVLASFHPNSEVGSHEGLADGHADRLLHLKMN